MNWLMMLSFSCGAWACAAGWAGVSAAPFSAIFYLRMSDVSAGV
ncbi:hypothetical protein ACFQ3C_10735 [Seohaeicola saemankumensis]|uniref:EamA family transporter n=1 Tax=Seohaeicola saemankumensis TaxID=481181 RepID=A0ABW3TGL1_9RHOB